MAEPERIGGGIALNMPANEEETAAAVASSRKVLPRRLRRRLLEPKSPVSAEEIEAKLKEADLRRQQYYETLSSKARPKIRSPSYSSVHAKDLGQRLEAKLNAAEQKRLSILEKAQTRLAKLDELRQAAKTGVELRFEKERDELGTKVEFRVQQAAKNRMLIFKAIAQQMAAKRQRVAQRLLQKMIQESKYKECVRAAIHQKRAAAEKKRLGFLEAEKRRAFTRLLRVRGVANSVYNQREMERRRTKVCLEDRLQRAKKLRAQYLKQRRSLQSHACPTPTMTQGNGELLSRLLARCWRRFLKYKKTTVTLAKAYNKLDINEKSVESMPFEQLALQINSAIVIRTVKALLDRLEIRLALSRAIMNIPSIMENIDHLLKRVASPSRRDKAMNTTGKGGEKLAASGERRAQKPSKLVRYPARVVLCAYVIRHHPDAVFRVRDEHEIALHEAAANFIQEFEMLIKITLDGSVHTHQEKATSGITSRRTFRSQLEAFDKTWCSYLHCFVAWKVKDVKLLEEDLARTAHQLDLSGVKKYKQPPEVGDGGLAHDMSTSEKQGMEDHGLSKEKVQPLSSSAGLDCTESALSAHARGDEPTEGHEKSGFTTSSTSSETTSEGHHNLDAALASENELIVNEIVHGNHRGFADSFTTGNDKINDLQAKVRETMEKAFWDSVMESMKQAEPDFSWVLKLMKEVRDELCDTSPKDWRHEIVQTIDTDVLSQILKSGSFEMDYFGKILEFALVTLQKLSSPAKEEEIRTAHHKLLKELGEIAQTGGQPNASYAILMVKGLRFVLQQIQVLKKEISKARLKILEPLLKGPAGLEYLKKAFAGRYGPPDQAPTSLPLTKRWLLSLQSDAEREWREYADSLSALTSNNVESSQSQGLPPTTLRTGGSFSAASKSNSLPSTRTGIELSECKGDKVDVLVRLGLLKRVNMIGGLTQENLPETLCLNLSRLGAVQSELQKIVVISASILILRQTLASENLVSNPADMEHTISEGVQRLSQLLDSVKDAGVQEIIETISVLPDGGGNSSVPEKLQTRKHVMASMIVKSLQAGDPIFNRISQAIYQATRAAALAGNNPKRKQLVEMALKRVGAGLLSDKVMEVADILVLVAVVSCNVHGPWYEELLKTK